MNESLKGLLYSTQGFMGSTNKNAAFYVWKVDEGHCRRRFLDEMYHAILNLRLRTTYEYDQKKEVALNGYYTNIASLAIACLRNQCWWIQ